ncbi:hypothetical protein [Chryseobacterium sp. ISL-6]|uniref:hypothetical protein n=1 Tax=Chryseobacterium sp. ISL-6 TaxID=2819143 RepID=UPI001BE7A476|nr:hypothetical protein [Chryseobacterium sp. ISL-6]MBT2621875.1 hypothetical protein [Chryseobacterium sp. ISL-6]
MKFVIIFILSFIMVSALPFFWNQFSFVELGFPFPFLQRMTIDDPLGTTTVVPYFKLNFVYDLVLVGICVWALNYYFKQRLRNNA